MIWGVIIGTYSSIFIGAPLLIFLGAKLDRPAGEEEASAEAARP